jgi:hypothetical protein
MLRSLALAAAIALGAVGVPHSARAQWILDLESGATFAGYNDVRIPGKGGTDISFTDDLSTDPGAFLRLRCTYRMRDRHNLSLLLAPLRLKAQGTLGSPLLFEGTEFPTGTALSGRYRFDSYRLTYRWDFRRRENLRLGFGFTAKIRDASVEVAGGGRKSIKKNTGFVPILNFALCWKARPPLSVILEGDALAAPQGRAEDVLAGVTYDLHPRLALKVGYRLLEGGADNDEVYNFTLVNYAALGLIARL